MTLPINKASVLILDDQLIQREGISRILESSDSMRLAGVAATSDQAMEILKSTEVELALVDLILKNEQGIIVGRAMRKLKPDLKVIIYTREKSMILAAEIVKESKENSEPRLHGYILTRKISSPTYLQTVYEQILNTGYYIDPDVLRWHYRLKDLEPLTPREEECAILVARGMSNPEIAERMVISLRRVENLNNALYLKFSILGKPRDPGRRVLLAEAIKLLYGHRLPAVNIRLLLIEDKVSVRTRLSQKISIGGELEVTAEANTGQKGIDLAKEMSPDIILTDVHLPDMDGFMVTRQILQSLPTAKVILISSDPSPTYIHEALRAGATGFIHKNQISVDAIMRLSYPVRY
jgi:DNA-binding NarL/FixJ family response regulator